LIAGMAGTCVGLTVGKEVKLLFGKAGSEGKLTGGNPPIGLGVVEEEPSCEGGLELRLGGTGVLINGKPVGTSGVLIFRGGKVES
jgi:hypothetical protein